MYKFRVCVIEICGRVKNRSRKTNRTPRSADLDTRESGFKKIIQAIIDHGEPMSGNQIFKNLSGCKNKIQATINEMIELEYLDRFGLGRNTKISVTPLGMELLVATDGDR